MKTFLLFEYFDDTALQILEVEPKCQTQTAKEGKLRTNQQKEQIADIWGVCAHESYIAVFQQENESCWKGKPKNRVWNQGRGTVSIKGNIGGQRMTLAQLVEAKTSQILELPCCVISAVACKTGIFVLGNQGDLWVYGTDSTDSKLLGLDSTKNSSLAEFKKIVFPEDADIKQFSIGEKHAVAVSGILFFK